MPSVLVVDDEPDLRTIVVMSLEGEGFDVSVVADGPDALSVLATDPPDILILDVMMPGMDGFDLLATIRQQDLAPDSRVVMLTCRTAERDYLRGWELGADEYLTKPFDVGILGEQLHRLMMATPEMLRNRRAAEFEKAALLDRLESAMRRPRRLTGAPA